MQTTLKVFTLDYSTWRCGGAGAHKLGDGATALLNSCGFTCCLGQAYLQLGFTREQILNFAGPSSPDVVRQNGMENFLVALEYNPHIERDNIVDSSFANAAMSINDDMNTTPEQKIALLRLLFESNGIEFNVINKPI